MNSGLFLNFDRNPIEALVLAQNENVHSAMIAWLIRNLNQRARKSLLTHLIGKEVEFSNVHAQTEWNKIDILIDFEVGGEKHYVAIENKLKASLRELQLEDADEVLKKHNNKPLKGFSFRILRTSLKPPKAGKCVPTMIFSAGCGKQSDTTALHIYETIWR